MLNGLVVITGQKWFSFTHWAVHFYFRFVNESPLLKAIIFLFLFLLTRRSWSLRKRLSHLRCASRSTTAWEESLSRRWASPPRSALTAAGLSHPPMWCFYVFLLLLGFISLFISMTHPLCNLPPHKNSILSFHLLSYIMPSSKMETSTPDS